MNERIVETITIKIKALPGVDYDETYNRVWDTRIEELKQIAVETFMHLPVEVIIDAE